MRQLGTEENAALLLSAADDEDEIDDGNLNDTKIPMNVSNDDYSVMTKCAKPYDHHHTSNTHPILCFGFILGAFILGCISGVVIILYRMSQNAGPPNPTSSSSSSLQIIPNVDLSIRTKLFHSISKTDFMNLNRSFESENNAANKLYEKWKLFSPALTRVNKFAYDLNLAKYTSVSQWSGIRLLDSKGETELLKIDRLLTENMISFASLVKSGTINANSIYYVNYGRPEDFAYLFSNRIRFQDHENSIIFMRRRSTIILQTEQIYQAIHYGFGALVLFDDDDNRLTTTTNGRHSFFREWAKYFTENERQKYLDGVLSDENHSIPVLILSFNDVQRLFEMLRQDSSSWLSCPTQWYDKPTALKIGGQLLNVKIQLLVNIESTQIDLPIVMGSIRGTIDTDDFIMIGYQLISIEQNRIINEMIEAFNNQMKNGWHPRRSILFCAWSGQDYDHYTARRWLSDNYRFIDQNLVAYLDLGHGILAKSILNLHGSPLLEQIARRAAGLVPSPLEHKTTCSPKLVTTTISSDEHHHEKKRRDAEDHEQRVERNIHDTNCEPFNLLDDWNQAVNNQFGSNKTLSIVQSIDIESSAALFQLHYGIPSLLIEMTQQQELTNDTFYVQHSSSVVESEIQPEVYVAYTQFVIEIIGQLIDEPIISFNSTDYANFIERQVTEFLAHYLGAYQSLGSHLGDISKFKETTGSLIKSIRKFQSCIDETARNKSIWFSRINKQLIEFERLFISNNHLPGMNAANKKFKHVLIGPAVGLTNTAVPFPLLSNILYGIPGDPPSELCDASKLFWLKLKGHLDMITRTLNGFDGLFQKEK